MTTLSSSKLARDAETKMAGYSAEVAKATARVSRAAALFSEAALLYSEALTAASAASTVILASMEERDQKKQEQKDKEEAEGAEIKAEDDRAWEEYVAEEARAEKKEKRKAERKAQVTDETKAKMIADYDAFMSCLICFRKHPTVECMHEGDGCHGKYCRACTMDNNEYYEAEPLDIEADDDSGDAVLYGGACSYCASIRADMRPRLLEVANERPDFEETLEEQHERFEELCVKAIAYLDRLDAYKGPSTQSAKAKARKAVTYFTWAAEELKRSIDEKERGDAEEEAKAKPAKKKAKAASNKGGKRKATAEKEEEKKKKPAKKQPKKQKTKAAAATDDEE